MKAKTILIDDTGTGVKYIGVSYGAATSDAAWKIKRVDESSNPTEITHADGDDRMDNIWDDRATLSYS